MTTTPHCESPIDTQTALLAEQYQAQGDLQLMLVRKIASLQLTNESIDRALDHLAPREHVYRHKIERFRKLKGHNDSSLAHMLNDLKSIQARQEYCA